jgi:monoamine oxidase
MPPLSRRHFLAASALAAAGPALAAAAPASGDVDVVIVGAGAAGIAAARRLVAAKQRIAVLEASDHIGGRCITDTKTFDVPYDRGAHWIHMPDINPVAKLGARSGLDIYRAPPGQKLRIGRRYAREGEMEEFLSSLVRSNRAIGEAARSGKGDISCAQALPKDLLDWRATVEFVLGPYGCAKDLGEVSVADFAQSAERDTDSFCRQGFGTLLARLAEGIPVQLGAPAMQITWGLRGGGVDVETPRGTFSGRAAIVTVSTAVLASGAIKFRPDLPKRQLDAAARLKLGSYDHVMLELPGNPFALQRDDLVFEKSDGSGTAALLANLSGTPLTQIDVGGKFGRDLAGKGEAAMVDFAIEWLTGLFGADVRKAVKRSHATRWNEEPWTLGAFSAAAPGGQPSRKTLMEPLGRLYLAGEAVHETLWGTVGGAFESGERAADAILKRIAAPLEPERSQRRPARRRRV